MNRLFLFLIISFGTVSVWADSGSTENVKSTDLNVKVTSARLGTRVNESDPSVTTESLSIFVPSGSIVNSTNPKVVPVQNTSVVKNISTNVNSSSYPKTSKPPPAQKTPGKPLIVPVTPKNDIQILKAPATAQTDKWIIRNTTTNMTCIIAQMAMQLNITYPASNNQVANAIIDLPSNVTLNGTCMGSKQSLVILWDPGYSLEINFAVNDTVKDFFVSGFLLRVNASIFNNSSENTTLSYENKNPEFITPLDMSYKCDRAQQVNLTSSKTKLPAVLTLKNTQLEAFVNSTKTDFGAAQDCDFFETPDIVPIAVGCALAILVLVVLVAYLIGRKRSQNRGYLSM